MKINEARKDDNEDYHCVHEAAFSYCRIEWPPVADFLGVFLFEVT